MGYHVVDPADVPTTDDYPCERRSITEAVGLANLAVAVYELAPGEQLPRTYHSHAQREEVFHVLEGPLHVETPGEEYVVPGGSVFVAEPRSPHRAFYPHGESGAARVVGTGAPRGDPGIPYEAE
jgi:quercetin dioxygenase-like cupin family protein